MNEANDSTAVAPPWEGLTREEKIAALASKQLAGSNSACTGGVFYVVRFNGKDLFVPVDAFEGFAASISND
jgi:hypothetical protein